MKEGSRTWNRILRYLDCKVKGQFGNQVVLFGENYSGEIIIWRKFLDYIKDILFFFFSSFICLYIIFTCCQASYQSLRYNSKKNKPALYYESKILFEEYTNI